MATCNQDFLSSPFKIVWKDEEGRAAVLFGAPAPFIAEIVFDKTPEPLKSQVWTAQRIEDTPYFAFINTEHELWAYARDRQVFCSLDYKKEVCMWRVERDDNGKYKIRIPDQDLFWTVREGVEGSSDTLFLEPGDGSENQKFSFVPLRSD